MKKETKIILIICGIILAIVVIGILFLKNNKIHYPDLPDNAIAFKTGEYLDVNDDNSSYLTIEYNGRTYILYGTIKRTIKEKDIDKCIGYVIQDENSSSLPDKNDKDTRIYTLTEDEEHNFLMEYYIGTNLMNQPYFYRAVDTKENNIFVPSYIDSLDYDYWK